MTHNARLSRLRPKSINTCYSISKFRFQPGLFRGACRAMHRSFIRTAIGRAMHRIANNGANTAKPDPMSEFCTIQYHCDTDHSVFASAVKPPRHGSGTGSRGKRRLIRQTKLPFVFNHRNYGAAWDGMILTCFAHSLIPRRPFRIGDEMCCGWVNFARTGTPATPELSFDS